MNTLSPWEREVVRQAVKEASEHSKAYRDKWTLPRERWGNEAQKAFDDENDRLHAAKVQRDTEDLFVEFLQAALRRSGAFVLFLE
jgi:hypothetical protein